MRNALQITLPQHRDPLARALLILLVGVVLWIAVTMPAQATYATAPIGIIEKLAIANGERRPGLVPILQRETAQPTPPLPTPDPAQLATPPTPTLPTPAEPTPAEPTPEPVAAIEQLAEQPAVSIGPQLPPAAVLVQTPGESYYQVPGSQVRYYVENGVVVDVRLPGVDTAANGADLADLTQHAREEQIAAEQAKLEAAQQKKPPQSERGYCPRCGYRPKK